MYIKYVTCIYRHGTADIKWQWTMIYRHGRNRVIKGHDNVMGSLILHMLS